MALEDPYWLDRDRGAGVRSHVNIMLGIADDLYRVIVPAMGDRYNGTAQSIYDALSDPTSSVYLTRSERIPLATIRQAIAIHNKHRPDLLDDYIARVKVPTKKGYLAVLNRQMPLDSI